MHARQAFSLSYIMDVVRWLKATTWIVVIIGIALSEEIQTEDIEITSTTSIPLEGDSCPCLPANICPRIYGASQNDSTYFGELLPCKDSGHVHCCREESSRISGDIGDFTTTEPINFTEELTTTNEPTTDNNWDMSTTTDDNWNIISTSTEQVSDGTEQPISTTTDTYQTTIDEDNTTIEDSGGHTTELIISAKAANIDAFKLRRPKVVDSVMMIYPSEMSGIPKTTPKNMLHSNEMKMYDETMGERLHLIFATNSTVTDDVPDDVASTENITTTSTTPKPTKVNVSDRKKRRRYRPNRGRTTETPSEIEATSAKNDTVATINKPIKPPTSINRSTSQARTRSPPQHTSDPIIDKNRSKNLRYRLFNSSNRLNFLRKTNEYISTTTESANSTTTEALVPNVTDDLSIVHPVVSPNHKFMNRIDNEHKYMIESMRLVLMTSATPSSSSSSATNNNIVKEAPPRLRQLNPSRRMVNVEQMVVNTLNNTFVQMVDHRLNRGPKRFQTSDINKSYLSSLTTQSSLSNKDGTTTATERPVRRGHIGKRLRTLQTTATTTTEAAIIRNVELNKIPSSETETNNKGETDKTFEASTEPDVKKPVTRLLKVLNRSYRPLLKSTLRITTTLSIPAATTEEPTTVEQQIATEGTAKIPKITTTSTTTPLPLRLEPMALIADFRPSPLWNLMSISGHATENVYETIEARQSRQSMTFLEPHQLVNGIVPVIVMDINQQQPLNIIGPIPKAYQAPTLNQIRYELPKSESYHF